MTGTSSDKPLIKLVVPDAQGGAGHDVSVYDAAAEQFAARLRKVHKERRKWARKEGIRCYRLYDADLPDYAVAIDYYECTEALPDASRDFAQVGEGFLYIAEYQAPKEIDQEKARRRLADVVALAPVVCGVLPEDVFVKTRLREKGGSQYAANGDSFTFCTREGACKVEVDLGAYLDTGLFLDHRTTRALVGRLCGGTPGKRFLNLFAYTGTCTLQAAAGGAGETTTVDLSQTYLDWARRNMDMNGFSGSQHAFERGDILTWLRGAAKSRRTFDVVFVDPPTFSNSKATKQTWDVQRDHVELLRLVRELLSPGAVVVFSCNLRSFKIDAGALANLGYDVEDITAQTIPHDFERNGKIHHCYMLKKAKK